MASPPVLDLETLLAPIPGETPAGNPVRRDIRDQLKEDRREENPEDFAPDDPMRPEEFKRADWRGIIRRTQDVLIGTSKDLLTAASLTEALTKEHRFAGLRDGLRLLRRLVDECWDRVNPVIEDGELEVRLTPFTWLDDADFGARFPNTLRGLPIIKGEERSYSWHEWRRAQDRQGPITAEEVQKAIQQTPAAYSQTVAEDISESVEELNQLTYKLNERMGPKAPSLSAIRQALEECALLARKIAKDKGAVTSGAEPAAATDNKAAEAGPARPARAAATREDAYRQLAEAAALLKQLEPHSPIPYFVERAVAMGALPFPLMIRELIREQAVITELNRELGIKEPPSES
jgi:type VI secretion system ImpA family protein